MKIRPNRKPGRVNVRAVVILVVLIAVLGGGALAAHHIRKRVMAKHALAAGQTALERGELVEACTQFKRYLGQYPDNVSILETYAQTNLAVRPRTAANVGQSIGAYRRLLRHKPADDRISDRLARLYLMRQEYRDAEFVCRQRLETAPSDAVTTSLLARSLLAQEQPAEAVKLLKELIETNPTAVEAYGLLAMAQFQLAQDDSREGETLAEPTEETARQLLDECVARNPEAPLAYILRAKFQRDTLSGRRERDVDAARADLTVADSLATSEPHVVLDLAREWLAIGATDRAEAVLERVRNPDPAVLLEHDLDPDKFALDWFLTKAAVERIQFDPVECAKVADDALAVLSGGYRSAFLESAIDLYLVAGKTDAAERVLGEYRQVVTGVPDGDLFSDNLLSLLAARVAYAQDKPYEVIDLLEPIVERDPENFAAWRLLGQSYVLTAQGRRAIRSLEECVRLRPGDEAAKMQLVKEYLKQQQWGKALQCARALNREDLEAELLRIEASLRSAMSEAATQSVLQRLEEDLVRLRDEHPKSSAVRMLLAALAEFSERYPEAEEGLRRAMNECDDTLDPALQLAQLYRRRGRIDQAIEVCDEAARGHPSRAEPWIRSAEYLERAERFDDARRKLEVALQSVQGDQQKREIEMAAARLLLRVDARAEAIAKLTAIAEGQPGDVDARTALLELPEIYRDSPRAQRLVDELKDIEGARSGLSWRLHQARVWMADERWKQHEREIVDVLSHCLNADPDWERPALVLGRMYELLGDSARAEQTYQRLLDLNPRAIAAVDRLLRLLEQQNRVVEAKKILDQLPPDLPGLTDHRVGLATATGEFETAIRELEKRVEADPRDAESRVLLARLVYREHHDAAEAFRILDQAVKIQSDLLAAPAVRAFILLSEGDAEQAHKVLDDEVARRNDFAAYLLRAQFHVARGETAAAEADYRRLTELDDPAAGFELLGRFYFSQGRQQEARQCWRQALERDPSRRGTQRLLVRANLVSDDEQERRSGREMLDRILTEDPADAEMLGVRARLLLNEGTADARREAKSVLERVASLDPRAVSAQLALVQLEFEDRDFEAAEKVVTRALGFNPQNIDLLMTQAELARAQMKLTRARELASAVLELDPDRAAAYALLTDVSYLGGDHDSALRMIEEAIRRSPETVMFQLKRAAVLEGLGRRGEAIAGLNQFLESDAKHETEQVLVALADLTCYEGDYNTFETLMGRVEQRWPGSVAALQKRLRCLGLQKRYDEVVSLVSRRQAEAPADGDTVVLGAGILAGSGAEALQRQAMALFDAVLKSNPNSVNALLAKAQLAYAMRNLEEAGDTYRAVLRLSPDHNQAINDLAWITGVELNKPADALELADRGVRLYGDDPHLLDTRGVILMKLGRSAEAARDLELASDLARARGVHRTQAQALIHLADVHTQDNLPAAARERLQQAQEIDQQFNVLNDSEREDLRARLASL